MEDETKYGDNISPIVESQSDSNPPDSSINSVEAECTEIGNLDEETSSPDKSYDDKKVMSSDLQPSLQPESDSLLNDGARLNHIDERFDIIEEGEKRLFSEVREMHKLYHTEFAGRLKNMQDELEQYRKIDKGRVFDDILASIARIYDNNESLVEETDDPKLKKSIQYMLMDLEDLMGEYGMTRLRSNQGDKRNPRHCQVLNRVQTDDPNKHDMIVKSYNSGFYIDNRTIIKEIVDIYIYETQSSTNNIEENKAEIIEKVTVTEIGG